MEEFKNILVVSRMTKYCEKAVHYGASLARQYNAKMTVVHVVHDPFGIEGWNLPVPNLEKDYQNLLVKSRKQLDEIIKRENENGMNIDVLIREGDPTSEILNVVKERKIDLIVMLAHEEGRIEHFLFGRSNHDIVVKMPCSVLLVKKEPERVSF